jgi:hypothetical protein
MFEKLFAKGPKAEDSEKKETIAGAEVIGEIPAKITIDKDGEKREKEGSIKVLLDENLEKEGREEGFSLEEE